MGELDQFPGSWHWPGPALSIVGSESVDRSLSLFLLPFFPLSLNSAFQIRDESHVFMRGEIGSLKGIDKPTEVHIAQVSLPVRALARRAHLEAVALDWQWLDMCGSSVPSLLGQPQRVLIQFCCSQMVSSRLGPRVTWEP